MAFVVVSRISSISSNSSSSRCCWCCCCCVFGCGLLDLIDDGSFYGGHGVLIESQVWMRVRRSSVSWLDDESNRGPSFLHQWVVKKKKRKRPLSLTVSWISAWDITGTQLLLVVSLFLKKCPRRPYLKKYRSFENALYTIRKISIRGKNIYLH